MSFLIRARNKIEGLFYINIMKPLFFSMDAELVHNFFIRLGKYLGSNWATKKATSIAFDYKNEMLKQRILGIDFNNPVGLSAGFDKNADLVNIIGDVGFGFEEIGSVTAKACAGNKGKRLDRIKDKKSLWVHLGLNNIGAKSVASKLINKRFSFPIGINIAKTNCKDTANVKSGIDDYASAIKEFNSKNIGDYFVINISCPNSYGGEPFSTPKNYNKLMREISKLKIKKPLFIKLSPDLSKRNVDELLKISSKYKIDGFVCSNLTKKHNLREGGLSGKAVEDKSNDLLKYVYSKTKEKYILIGVGGIFSAADAYRKIKLGASLVELITGMVYLGPGLISEINLGLVKLLKSDGFSNISEAIGVDVK